jgi:hypothetical protein
MKTKTINYLKRNFVAKLLALILFLSINAGLVIAIKHYLDNRETPIAKNVEYHSTEYSAFEMEELSNIADMVGGSFDVFDSQEERDTYQKSKQTVVKDEKLKEAILSNIRNFEPKKQRITVLDKLTNLPMSNVLVSLDGIPRFTGIDGSITTTIENEYVKLLVQSPDNEYIPHIEYIQATGGDYTVTLRRPSDSIEFFATVMSYDGDNINLLTQSYTIDQNSEASSDIATIRVTTNLPQADKYYIKQNGKIVKESTTQDIVVNMVDDFVVDGDVVIGVEWEGVVKEVTTLLSFVYIDTINIAEMLALSSQDGISVDIGNEILESIEFSFLSGMSNMFELKRTEKTNWGIGFSIVHDNRNGIICIAVGLRLSINIRETNRDKLAIFDAFKYAYDAISKNGYGTIQSLKNSFGFIESLSSKFEAQSPKFSLDFDFEVNGFAEIYDVPRFINGELKQFKSISFDINLGISFTIGFQFIVFFVPVYLTITLGFNAEFIFLWNEYTEFIFKIILKLYVKLGVGIGVQGIAGVNAYGQANFKFIYENNPDEESWIFSIDLQFGIEGTILLWSFDVPIGEPIQWEDKLLFYRPKTKLSELAKNDKSREKSSDTLSTINRSPQIVTIGNKKIMSWIDRDSSRDEYNYTALHYSIYENGQWGQIKIVQNNNTADFLPSLYSDGENAFVVWQSLSKKMSGNNTLEDMLSASEIYISQFDFDTNTFDSPMQISTSSTRLQTMPKFAKSQDSKDPITVVWLSNTENDPFGQIGVNELYSSTLSNGQWSLPNKVYETTQPIISFDTAYINGQLNFAINQDVDNDLTTIDDRDIILYTNREQIVLGDDEIVDSNPQFSVHNDRLSLFFYSDTNIVYIDNFIALTVNSVTQNDQLQTSGDDFTPISDGSHTIILYPQNNGNDNGNKLLASIFDSQQNAWNNNIEIDNIDQEIDFIIAEFDGNTIHYAYLDDSITTNNQIQFDSYLIGNSIKIDNAFMIENIKYNSFNDIYIDIINNGAYGIDNFEIEILDKAYPISLEESLLVGQQININVPIYIEATIESLTIKVLLGGVEQGRYVMPIFNSQFTMTIYKFVDIDKEWFIATITNEGILDDTVQITVKEFDQNGRLLHKSMQIDIAKGETKSLRIELDYEQLELFGANQICFELATTHPQMYSVDNKQLISGAIKVDNSQLELYLQLKEALEQAKRLLI